MNKLLAALIASLFAAGAMAQDEMKASKAAAAKATTQKGVVAVKPNTDSKKAVSTTAVAGGTAATKAAPSSVGAAKAAGGNAAMKAGPAK